MNGRKQWIKTIRYEDNECPLYDSCKNSIKRWKGSWLLCQCTKDKLTLHSVLDYYVRRPHLKLEDDGDDYEIICYDVVNENKEVITLLRKEMGGYVNE